MMLLCAVSFFRRACSIGLPEMFILTGGIYTMTTVSRYSINGWMEDLPELNEGRRYHGCGYFYNDDMQTVSFRHPPIKQGLLIMEMCKDNLFLKNLLIIIRCSLLLVAMMVLE